MRGKPVVVNIWASWCYYCTLEMPDFQRAYDKYGDEVVFMMIDATDGGRETVSSGKDFIRMKGYTFPVYFDTEYFAVNAYYVRGLPATYYIDAEGKIAASSPRMTDFESIEEAIILITE